VRWLTVDVLDFRGDEGIGEELGVVEERVSSI